MKEFDFIFEVADEIILIINSSNFKILKSNPSAQRIYDYSADEFLQLTLYDIFKDPIDLKNIMKNKLQLHKKKNGNEFLVEIVDSLSNNESITLIIKNLENVFELENKLLPLFDDLSFYIFLKNLDNRIIWMNRSLTEIIGIQKDIDPNNIWSEFPNNKFLSKYAMDDEEVIKTKKPICNFIDEFITKTGETRWVLTSKIPYLNSKKEVLGIFGVSFDITEYRSQNLEFELLLNSTSDSIIITDFEKNILKVYGGKINLFDNKIEGKKLDNIFNSYPATNSEITRAFSTLLDKKSKHVEFEFKINNNSYEGFLDFFNHTKIVAVIHDITLRRKLDKFDILLNEVRTANMSLIKSLA